MSTGLECLIVEHTPGHWYYVLQDWDCPVGAWDWMEYATAYGPFRSEDDANRHLSQNHANPGGSYTRYFKPDRKPNPTIDQLVKDATR
jgi:hypothetical protein